jgi:invasion protein IalB
MPSLKTLLPASAGLILPLLLAASPLSAQTTDSAIANDLSLGEPENSAPAVGQPYSKTTNGDWTMRCIKAEEGEDPCQMYQLLEDADGNAIAEFSLFRLPEDNQAKAGATVIVPLETSLGAQLTIKVDDKPAKRYPFAFCNTVGCYSRIGLTQEDIDSFKKGAAAVLTIVPIVAPDQKVNVTLSLSGFTASFEQSSVMDR